MSEVKRYEINGTFEVPETGQKLVNPKMVMESDFDRVTAERDAARETLERWYRLNVQREAKVDALQQRLTAADERADVLEGLLHKAHPFTNDVAHDVDVWLEIDAALKPVNGDCHHGYASILECPECGEPYQ